MDAANQPIMAPLSTPMIPRLIRGSSLKLASKQVLVISFPGEVSESPFCGSSSQPLAHSCHPAAGTLFQEAAVGFNRETGWAVRTNLRVKSDHYVDWSWLHIPLSACFPFQSYYRNILYYILRYPTGTQRFQNPILISSFLWLTRSRMTLSRALPGAS